MVEKVAAELVGAHCDRVQGFHLGQTDAESGGRQWTRWGQPRCYFNFSLTYSHLSKVFVKRPAALTEPPQQHFSIRKLLLPNNNFCAIENEIGEYKDTVGHIFMVTRNLK